MLRRRLLSVFLLYAIFIPSVALAQTSASIPAAATVKSYAAPKEVIDKIKEEG